MKLAVQYRVVGTEVVVQITLGANDGATTALAEESLGGPFCLDSEGI